ncbi:MAG: S9 family peptidase [Acidobacteria bacterium]|nr:S9 family peptidase [Acidobacteriota bacterium]MCB9377372.1 S9 family peptidase [Holophagales bacterium]
MLACFASSRAVADEGAAAGDVAARLEALEQRLDALQHTFDALTKKIDDVLWFERVGDVARVDKVYLPTVPNPKEEETYGIANERHPFKIWSYVFVPRQIAPGARRPLLVLPHGGVHGDFDTYYTHIVRELMEQGYVVVAPEYRGSTGYGKEYWEAIDYGGLEVADVVAVRDWAVAALPEVDAGRVGILGWSHGGLIALLSVFDHPDKFQVAYAGVPVSDLLARMGYQTEEYRELYSADYHLGKTAYQDVDEYRRRSPAWNARKLSTPLLVHTTTNDRDVNVVEVEHLIQALQAADKRFEYEIYQDFPGGHTLNRSDSLLARESRQGVWRFLARYLKP